MIVRGVEFVGEEATPVSVVFSGRTIVGVGSKEPDPARYGPLLDFRNAIAFPGLVNSHDHLEFNAYPALGHEHYADYVEWGNDIHRRDRDLISRMQRVPKGDRLRWGALKNLLCGVTTVAHHGDAHDDLHGVPIGLTPGSSIHSVRLAPRWRWRLNAPVGRPPYVVHVGEGTTPGARREIDDLLRWNLLRRSLVGVHAIAMGPEQAARFRAVVWCPVSNEFLYGRTAEIALLKKVTTVLFGTDSTLTGDWSFWKHLRRARALAALDDRELFAAVTSAAAGVWGDPGLGRVAPGCPADLVVAKKKAERPWDAFFAVDPEDILLVIRRGEVVLHDASVDAVVRSGPVSAVRIGGREKRIAGELGGIAARLRDWGIEPNFGAWEL